MRRFTKLLLAAATTVALIAGATSSASAATPTGQYAPFKYCPYTNQAVFSCLYSVTNSGSFKLGTSTVPINKPITLQGGYSFNDDGSNTFYNAVGADTLSKTKLDVPGGLAGIVNPGGFFGPLVAAFENAIRSFNGVTATAELVGPVGFNANNLFALSGTAITLPVRIHLENPFLGSNCYVGSSSNPVTLRLTVGTTSPPPPNRPISGDGGTVTSSDDANVLYDTGIKLVDNAFAVPAASGCGNTILDKPLITAAVNLKEGFPSAAGKNSAILQGNTQIAYRDAVEASAR